MSLKEKFGKIKEGVEARQKVEKIESGQQIVGEIGNERQSLANRVADLKQLLAQLESSYSNSKTSLSEFKNAKKSITELYEQYADALKEEGINSVEDILNDAKFSNEEEVVEYKNKGAAKVKGKRGALGEQVESLAKTKKKIKEELPEEDLDFRGGADKEGESPRERSILKIKNHINKLQAELDKVKQREEELKQEYLPAIEDMLKKRLDEILPDMNNLSISPKAANLNFISPEVFKFAGDVHWEEVKILAIGLINDRFNKASGNMRIGYHDLDQSLEAEKLIFDVETIRSENQELLNEREDLSHLNGVEGEINNSLFRIRGKSEEEKLLVIKDKILFPGDFLKRVEALNEKNPEAKRVCEEVKANLMALLEKTQEGIKTGFLDGKSTKISKQEVREELEKSKKRLNELAIPEYFYSPENRWDFPNGISNAQPVRYNQAEWFKPLRESLTAEWEVEVKKISSLHDDNNKELRQLNDELYAYGSFDFQNVAGFKLPVINLEKAYSYQGIKDKTLINSLLEDINGLELSQTQLHDQFEAKRAILVAQMNEHPNSQAVLARFDALLKKYEEKFKFSSALVDIKMQTKKNRNFRPGFKDKGDYQIKKELFYE